MFIHAESQRRGISIAETRSASLKGHRRILGGLGAASALNNRPRACLGYELQKKYMVVSIEGEPILEIDPLIGFVRIVDVIKALALVTLFLFRGREIDSLLDGLIYGAAVGFGFAAAENIGYFIGASNQLEISGVGSVILLRTFVFGTNHAIFTGITGLGFALARFNT